MFIFEDSDSVQMDPFGSVCVYSHSYILGRVNLDPPKGTGFLWGGLNRPFEKSWSNNTVMIHIILKESLFYVVYQLYSSYL